MINKLNKLNKVRDNKMMNYSNFKEYLLQIQNYREQYCIKLINIKIQNKGSSMDISKQVRKN